MVGSVLRGERRPASTRIRTESREPDHTAWCSGIAGAYGRFCTIYHSPRLFKRSAAN